MKGRPKGRHSIMKEYIGHSAQLFEVKQYTLTDGRANGTRAISVWNGAGLTYTLLPDRCLDIADVRFNGNNMSYLTPSGIVNPMYFEADGINWLRSFAGGFLTTCGLENIGSTDDTPGLTMHGRIGNMPCDNVCCDLAPDGMSATIFGTAKEATLFGCKLTLRRTYECAYGEDKITFTDVITNNGFERIPVSALYHMNLGYPLLSEKAKLVIPSVEVTPRNEHAANHVTDWNKLVPPQHGFEEMCYYHKLSENCYGIDNPAIGVSMRISFESNGLLDRLIQWRMLGECEYVMGLEASSCTLEGRKDAIANGSQKYLEPGQSFTNRFTITFKVI